MLERRRLSRLAESVPRVGVTGPPGAESTGRGVRLRRELRVYLAEDEHPAEGGFSLPLYWLCRGSAGTCVDTGQTISAASLWFEWVSFCLGLGFGRLPLPFRADSLLRGLWSGYYTRIVLKYL